MKASFRSIHHARKDSSESQTCKAGDSEFEVVGENGTTGLIWAPEDGEYYVGIGTLGERIIQLVRDSNWMLPLN